MTFGLYQSSLSREAEETYREALRRVMLPRLLLRLEAAMRTDGADPMRLYEPLKVYLMLGQQGPMDAKTVRAWVTNDWATQVYPGADSQGERDHDSPRVPNVDGEGIVRQLQKMAQAAKETLPKLWPLLFLLLLSRLSDLLCSLLLSLFKSASSSQMSSSSSLALNALTALSVSRGIGAEP